MEMSTTNHLKVYAAILAGGSGIRMGNPEKPKQYYALGSKPIMVHTVEKFIATGLFEKIIVLCPEGWEQQTRDLLDRYCGAQSDLIDVLLGGATRADTVETAVGYMIERFDVDENTLIVTHDAVRPFVTHRIIKENIQEAAKHGACDTVIPATDTIVKSVDGLTLCSIPDRSLFYQGQTPQTFNLLKMKVLLDGLAASEKKGLTDACGIFTLRGEKVAMVRGEPTNIKITYPHDMRIASSLLGDPRV